MYDHCFSVENWLGQRFCDSNWACLEMGYLFSLFNVQEYHYGNNNILLSKKQLKEIPFALWLREKLVIPNLGNLFGRDVEHDLNWMPDCLKWTVVLTCMVITLILALPLWLLNQFLSLAIVPVVTKVRELLGWGRMIRLG